MKILVIALSGIGDALMFTPALKLIRKMMPDAEIDALVMIKAVKDIYERNPDINKVHFFKFIEEGSINSLKFVIGLRKKYDVSINVYPSNRKEYNIINFLTGAKKRAGVKYLRMDKQDLGFLNNVRITENDLLHNVQENIKLCEKLFNTKFSEEPCLSITLNDEDKKAGDKFIAENKIVPDDLIIGFHPGSATLKNHIHRRWEPEKFAELGRKLIENDNAKILIFGGPEEDELKELIAEKINHEDCLVVKSDGFCESAAIMQRCNIFISNDSSLMHTAAALKLKVVAILGPTNPNYIHPWKTEHKIVRLDLDCSPCFVYSPKPLTCIRDDVKFKCIKELTVEMIYKAVREFLETEKRNTNS